MGQHRSSASPRRILVVQLHGDYREAYERIRNGGPEYYYGQRYSVDAVAQLRRGPGDEVATLCGFTDEPYDELVAPGVRAIGAGFKTRVDDRALVRLVRDYKPTHLVLRVKVLRLLRWAVRQEIPSVVVLGESLSKGRIGTKIRNRAIVRALNKDAIRWVGAYGISSARSFARAGVRPDKIVPWDFLFERPESFATKRLRSSKPPWNLCFVGSLVEGKGVGDILEAAAQLKENGIEVRLDIAGPDTDGHWAALGEELGLGEQINFRGLVPTDEAISMMREADAVLVPSRHRYPEGFPLVIAHAIQAGTPLIASDHPRFREHLQDGNNALICPQADPAALAGCIRGLLTDPALYARLSSSTRASWSALSLPVKFAELITRWLSASERDRNWLHAHRLTSDVYTTLAPPQGIGLPGLKPEHAASSPQPKPAAVASKAARSEAVSSSSTS